MTDLTQLTQDRIGENGNTNHSPKRARCWLITCNNYTDNDIKLLKLIFIDCNKWVWQQEEGEECKTPHFHAYLEFKSARSFKTMKNKIPRANLEPVRNKQATIDYCRKIDTRTLGPWMSENLKPVIPLKEKLLNKIYENTIWKDWQQDIIDMLENEPDKRKIIWIYDLNGNVGKSFLCKYIGLKYDALICSGKTNDIFNQCNQWRIANPNIMQIPPCIIDVPRSEFSHVNYAAIESLKNGFLYSGKYEGGAIYGLEPHIVIFANNRPDENKMSNDRWDIREVVIPTTP